MLLFTSIIIAGVANAHTAPEDMLAAATASSGTMLLQRPNMLFSHVVDLSEAPGEVQRSFSKQTPAEQSVPHSSAAGAGGFWELLQSQMQIPVDHEAAHFGGALAGLTGEQGLAPLTVHEPFSILVSGEWSRWTPHHPAHKHHGVHHFFSSVVFFDWCLFGSAIMVFFILHLLILGRMEAEGKHCAVLAIWLAVGVVYNAIIWGRFGSNAGISWFTGYLLELIFLVENIFIFHIVIRAFKTPVKLTTKALHIVVWAQIMFEMVFFMGLAHWLRRFTVLPYILGVWLICCGFLAAQGEPSFEGEIMDTSACRAFTSCLGDRLSKSYQKDGECFLFDNTGKMRVSLLGLVVAVLLAVDFMLEIDVVLTKIEELPNPYIAFTSSAVAAFSIPDLFFVAKGLLKRFKMLKYGIGFVLILFGTQMLLSSLFILQPIVACFIIIGVLIICIVVSLCQSLCGGAGNDAGCAGAALSEVGQDDTSSTKEAGNPQDFCNPTPEQSTPDPDLGETQETETLEATY